MSFFALTESLRCLLGADSNDVMNRSVRHHAVLLVGAFQGLVEPLKLIEGLVVRSCNAMNVSQVRPQSSQFRLNDVTVRIAVNDTTDGLVVEYRSLRCSDGNRKLQYSLASGPLAQPFPRRALDVLPCVVPPPRGRGTPRPSPRTVPLLLRRLGVLLRVCDSKACGDIFQADPRS